jgi:hypothetical protein
MEHVRLVSAAAALDPRLQARRLDRPSTADHALEAVQITGFEGATRGDGVTAGDDGCFRDRQEGAVHTATTAR